MSNAEAAGVALEPLRKTVVVRRSPTEAFAIFTERFGSWWPYTQFSLHQAETASCAFEARAGGAIYERTKSGERAVWGAVRAWNPPHGFVIAWHPGSPPEQATEVELMFEPVAEGTRVTLEHRDWAKLGADAAKARGNYENGWVVVFEQRYAGACA
jgi:uncharacterized protein YndB with AHSA1/START domain